MKLTLLHKGLLLVSIPLCFEITIFGVLINMQDHLEHEAQRINHNKKINDRVNLILRDILTISNAMRDSSSFKALNTSLLSKTIGEQIGDIRQNFSELESLAQNDPAVLERVLKCEDGMRLAFEDIKLLKQRVRAATFEQLPKIAHDSETQIELHLRMAVEAGFFELAQRSLQGTSDFLSKQIWDQMRVLLKCALAFSALVALSGTYIFSKHLVGRLSLLSDNAERLGTGKAMLPLIGGTDEIAELDRNFHHAAELIVAAKRMRQEVTAMITHDLKTPLQTVRSYLEMLEQGCFGKLKESGIRLLAITQNSCEQMSGLIDSVLRLERLRSGAVRLKTSRIELAPFLDNCLDSVKLMAEEKNISVARNYKSFGSETVIGDPFWLGQVIVNILSNAVKFSPRDSTVSVTTGSSNDNVEIRIADQGPGIPDQDIKLIFDRFHRVQSTASLAGTGLGLPIAKELIELHKGTIAVESAEGKGCTFAIRLPTSKTVSVEQSLKFFGRLVVGSDLEADRLQLRTDGAAHQTSQLDSKSSTAAAGNPEAGGEASRTRPNRFKLNLLHKGLILISIPLCFEVTIFGFLITLQDQVEQEAQRITRNKKFNDAANVVMRDLVYLGINMGQKSTRTTISHGQIRQRLNEIKQSFEELKQLDQQPRVVAAVQDGENGLDLLYLELSGNKRSMPHSEMGEIAAQINSRFTTAMLHLGQRSVSSNYDLRSNQIREQIRLLLRCAVGLSVLFALLGAAMYGKHLVGRLSRVSENAGRLAKGEALLAPVGGTDEIAELDANFHYAAGLIEAAKRMRQEATAMITHDLKTPLQSVRSYFEMLDHGSFGELDEPGKRLLTSSQKASRHMVDLINSVLQLEKLRTGNVQLQVSPIELPSLLDKCVDSVKLLAEQKDVALLRVYKESDWAMIDGDAFWLEQVFVNLLSNAIKFSPPQSTVSISLKQVDHSLETSIVDQGAGIPEQDLNLIFDRFHRVESTASVPGTGLGLPIAKELVELHHGSIKAESTVGKGSIFSIRLPLAADSKSAV